MLLLCCLIGKTRGFCPLQAIHTNLCPDYTRSKNLLIFFVLIRLADYLRLNDIITTTGDFP